MKGWECLSEVKKLEDVKEVSKQSVGGGRAGVKKKGSILGLKIPVAIVGLILAIVVVGGAIGVREFPQIVGLSPSDDSAITEIKELVEDVGSLIELPSDEDATVATVTDVERVREQSFFRNAENDDKVLIYANAKKVILYRPSTNKIIEVGSVNIAQGDAQDSIQVEEVEESVEEKVIEAVEPEVIVE